MEMEKKLEFLKGKEVLAKSEDGSIVICHQFANEDEDWLCVNTVSVTTQEEREIIEQVPGVEKEISIGKYFHLWEVAALYDATAVADVIVTALEANRINNAECGQ